VDYGIYFQADIAVPSDHLVKLIRMRVGWYGNCLILKANRRISIFAFSKVSISVKLDARGQRLSAYDIEGFQRLLLCHPTPEPGDVSGRPNHQITVLKK
jgi:hypothetical protein